MNTVVDNLEAVLIEAHKIKGWQWVNDEPLWVTWSLGKFSKYSSPYPLRGLPMIPLASRLNIRHHHPIPSLAKYAY
jgi:hypothetical protein